MPDNAGGAGTPDNAGAGGRPDNAGGGGKPDDPGGGEDTDAVGNNLSMPVLFSEDGYALTLQGTMDAPLITTVVQSTIEGETCFGAPQKTAGNLWQADNLLVPGNAVSLVDQWATHWRPPTRGACSGWRRVSTPQWPG